jgi:glycine cleavage system H protein
MIEYLETTVDKFIFKVATDRLYTPEGLWVKQEDSGIKLGVSDFFQQRNGDIAFADLQPVGTTLQLEDEVASIETIKVNVALGSPLTGTIQDINQQLAKAPEVINQDPYGEGWLCVISADNWPAESKKFLAPEQYFVKMKKDAEEEVKKNE